MKDYLLKTFGDPGFLGSLLGSILTGAIALMIYWGQNKREENKENEAEWKNFLKEFQKIRYLFCDGIQYNIINLIEYIKKNQPPLMSTINNYVLGFREMIERYGNINEDSIPQPVFLDYLNFNRSIEELDNLLKTKFISKTPIIDDEFILEILRHRDEIFRNYSKIDNYFKKNKI